jgi:hypothetical protein
VQFWISKVEEGHASKVRQGFVRKDETCILMDPKWAKLVIDYISLGARKVQVIKMKGLPCGNLVIINIYASNSL